MGILKMLKSWAIAISLFIAAAFLSFFWGKRKQKIVDKLESANETSKDVSNIIEISKAVRSNVAKRPANGADSSNDELRRNWEIPTS